MCSGLIALTTIGKSKKWLGTEWLGIEYKTVTLAKTEQYHEYTRSDNIVNKYLNERVYNIFRGHKRNAKTFEIHIDVRQNKITTVWETALVCN